MWISVAVIDAILAWVITLLMANGSYALGVIVVLLLIFIDYALINPKGYPFKYMIPAIIILMILTVYPIYFTVQLAFQNYETGYMWTRDQAVNIMLDTIVISPNPKFFNYSVYTLYKDYKPTDDFVMLLKDSNGNLYI